MPDIPNFRNPTCTTRIRPAILSGLGFLLFFSLIITSCDSARVFEENREIPNQRWAHDQYLVFHVDITDTVSAHNIDINIRNSGQYPYSNLFLFITTKAPSGQWSRDTVECVLANEKGRWLGSGLGDMYDLRIPYKRNVRFPLEGRYIFEFEQAMRTEELRYILDAGLRIERVK